jgi:hypothetical protein
VVIFFFPSDLADNLRGNRHPHRFLIQALQPVNLPRQINAAIVNRGGLYRAACGEKGKGNHAK